MSEDIKDAEYIAEMKDAMEKHNQAITMLKEKVTTQDAENRRLRAVLACTGLDPDMPIPPSTLTQVNDSVAILRQALNDILHHEATETWWDSHSDEERKAEFIKLNQLTRAFQRIKQLEALLQATEPTTEATKSDSDAILEGIEGIARLIAMQNTGGYADEAFWKVVEQMKERRLGMH